MALKKFKIKKLNTKHFLVISIFILLSAFIVFFLDYDIALFNYLIPMHFLWIKIVIGLFGLFFTLILIESLLFRSSVKLVLDSQGISMESEIPNWWPLPFHKPKTIFWNEIKDIKTHVYKKSLSLTLVGPKYNMSLNSRNFPVQELLLELQSRKELQGFFESKEKKPKEKTLKDV